MAGVNPIHLLTAALVLTEHDTGGRPRQAHLRRALSTSYYAMFHCLSAANADVLIGTSQRTSDAWVSAYRELDHNLAYKRCNRSAVSTFPAVVIRFASTLRKLKELREDADYNPAATFSRFDVYQQILDTFRAIVDYQRVPAASRREFAAHVLFKKR